MVKNLVHFTSTKRILASKGKGQKRAPTPASATMAVVAAGVMVAMEVDGLSKSNDCTLQIYEPI